MLGMLLKYNFSERYSANLIIHIHIEMVEKLNGRSTLLFNKADAKILPVFLHSPSLESAGLGWHIGC